MKNVPSYARVVAGSLARQWRNKPLFGKAFLKRGQWFGLWGYLFELGGILATKHVSNLNAFGPAFLGMSGPAGAIKERGWTALPARPITSSSETIPRARPRLRPWLDVPLISRVRRSLLTRRNRLWADYKTGAAPPPLTGKPISSHRMTISQP